MGVIPRHGVRESLQHMHRLAISAAVCGWAVLPPQELEHNSNNVHLDGIRSNLLMGRVVPPGVNNQVQTQMQQLTISDAVSGWGWFPPKELNRSPNHVKFCNSRCTFWMHWFPPPRLGNKCKHTILKISETVRGWCWLPPLGVRRYLHASFVDIRSSLWMGRPSPQRARRELQTHIVWQYLQQHGHGVGFPPMGFEHSCKHPPPANIRNSLWMGLASLQGAKSQLQTCAVV